MTDKPAESAVERYEKARQPIDVVPESAPSNTAGLLTADLGFTIFVEGRLADAAIAELKAEVERLKCCEERVCTTCLFSGDCKTQTAEPKEFICDTPFGCNRWEERP